MKIQQALIARNLSPRTQEAYCAHENRFLGKQNRSPRVETSQSVQAYLIGLLNFEGLSASSVNLHRNALQFFFEKILGSTIVSSLAYGGGLRVSEIVALKIKDVDFARNLFDQVKPKIFVFENEYGYGFTRRWAQNLFKRALEKSEIRKQASIHSNVTGSSRSENNGEIYTCKPECDQRDSESL